ncbi:MAG: hypothetical protein KC656_14920 [Myxococcales bacterium]|nr:hypothetical protein [Myxococcales bacterium]MCB9673058.1 hypothetical protein [Alphaproteobacteria bacterium]MCB9694898.1 hypothetical protein [Alphaproteobacteria bacterium]
MFLAASCAQGATQIEGLKALLRLQPAGLQLTPGWFPVPGFRELLDRVRLPVRLHDGFSWTAYRRPVWGEGRLLLGRAGAGHSLHPPRRPWEGWLETAVQAGYAVEVMPPGRALSTAPELERALELRAPLALDIAHLHLLALAGVSDRVLRRILDSPDVAEVHVSASDGRVDAHLPATRDSWLAGWALERKADGVPLIVECRFQGLDPGERERALEAFR